MVSVTYRTLCISHCALVLIASPLSSRWKWCVLSENFSCCENNVFLSKVLLTRQRRGAAQPGFLVLYLHSRDKNVKVWLYRASESVAWLNGCSGRPGKACTGPGCQSVSCDTLLACGLLCRTNLHDHSSYGRAAKRLLGVLGHIHYSGIKVGCVSIQFTK